jgi:hypothetical protein
MKQRFNAWAVSIALVASLPAALAPIGAHASTAVNASWVQSSAQGPSPRAGVSLAYDTMNRHTVLFGGSPGSSYMSDTWTYDGSTWTQLQTSGPSARYLSPMAFDTSRGVAVLFGGYGDPGYLQDTWELSGSTWLRRFPQHAPPARDWSAMTYDSRRHVMVLFGGTGASGLLNDTWEYDGNDWTQVMPVHAPSPRRGMGLAFDSLRGKTVLYGGEADVPQRDTWEYDGVDWTQVVLSTSPNYRMWQGMAFDGALGVIVMFGGLEAGALNDETWIYDGSSWTQIQLAIAPGARFWAPLAYDSDRGALVLFGGTTAPGGPGSQVFGDTWSLTGAPTAPVDWLQINPAASPSPRAFSQMDYDSARGVTVLFGGSSDAGAANLADTWEWNGFNRAQMSPSASPAALDGGSIAYDSARGVSVLFGGDGSSGTSSSTWEWDGASWTLRTPATSPPATVFGAMSYDSARGRMVLFGTSSNTWEYDGTTWTQIFPANSPSPRFGSAMAYDPTLRRTVLFGGLDANGQRLADTWEWDGSDWTQIATATAPHPRFWATLAFDAQRGRTVLIGGDHFQPGDFGESNDTWEWDGAQWTRDWPTAAPAIRSGQAMAYDTGRGRMVVFGGWNAATSPPTIYGDTWEFGSGVPAATGTAAATLGLFGSGTNFGSVNVGSTSSNVAVFRLDSTGAGPLTVNAITYNGPSDFTMTTDCPVAGNPLPSGSYCVTLVSFTPASGGTKTATLSFDYNAPGGSQTFQVQGTGVVLPTALTVSPATATYSGGATITAHLTANGSAFSGQSVTLTLPNGGTATTATDSSGIALFVGVSLAGIHAGTYPTGIQAGFAGTPAYAPSSASAQLTITQPVTTSYTGTFLVAGNTPPKVALTVDQRTPASDPQFIDYSSVQVWARFTVSSAGGSTDFYGQVTDAGDWTASGLGVASANLPLLPDGAYTVTATLVGASGSAALSTSVAGDDARVGLAASPTKGGYLSGGGAIAADPSANTSDTHGYFSLELTPGSTPHGNVVYVYRVRMDVGGGNMRDVDVWVTSTDVTSLSGNGSSAAATGHFSVAYVDSQTGQHYSSFEFSGGTFKLNEANSTSKAPAGISIVMQRPDGTIFHATAPVNAGGNAPLSPVVVGSLASHL